MESLRLVKSSICSRGMPGPQLVFLGLFAATWLIGGNIVISRYFRRRGKSPWSGFRPFVSPWKDFNAQEWLSLLALGVVSLTFGAIALSFSPK